MDCGSVAECDVLPEYAEWGDVLPLCRLHERVWTLYSSCLALKVCLGFTAIINMREEAADTKTSLKDALFETEWIMFDCVDALLKKTSTDPSEVSLSCWSFAHSKYLVSGEPYSLLILIQTHSSKEREHAMGSICSVLH
jgi:hypothetical protein